MKPYFCSDPSKGKESNGLLCLLTSLLLSLSLILSFYQTSLLPTRTSSTLFSRNSVFISWIDMWRCKWHAMHVECLESLLLEIVRPTQPLFPLNIYRVLKCGLGRQSAKTGVTVFGFCLGISSDPGSPWCYSETLMVGLSLFVYCCFVFSKSHFSPLETHDGNIVVKALGKGA